MDANAAKGITERLGVSTIRHLDTDVLCLQQVGKSMPLKTINGVDNPADIMTKHVSPETRAKHVAGLRLEHQQGRAHATAHVHLLQPGGRGD